MNKKKILIVSRSFYPMNSPRSFRTTELVKEFARQGHEVTLLTVKKEDKHSSFEKEYGVTIKDIGQLRFPKVILNGGNGPVHLLKRIIRRAMGLLFEYPSIELMFKVKKALKLEAGYDLMISVAVPYPVHWGVAWAWQENNPIADTWVADCGDPYMGAQLDSFDKLFYFKYLEKYFCKNTDYISVPHKDAKNGYYPEFREKIKVIPQGFEFDGVEIDHSSYTPNPIPTFAYAGDLIPGGRDPREFLDYLLTLDQEYKFTLFLKNPKLVEPYVGASNGNIEIRDYIPRRELLKYLTGMDFLVNFENSTSIQLPSKLIDYYLTGRPVLSVGSVDINKTAVNEFIRGKYRSRHDYKDMDRYRIENVCGRFLGLCKDKVYP